MDNDLLKYVVQCSSNCGDSYLDGTIGKLLVEKAKQKLKSYEVEDDDEKKKLQYLQSCEQQNDLCYMDYDSWNIFAKDFQNKFIELVDPFFCGGLYFKYSLISKDLMDSFKNISSDTVIYISHYSSKNYRLSCIDSNPRSPINKLGTVKFKALSKEFLKDLLISIGKDKFNKLKINYVSEKTTNSSSI